MVATDVKTPAKGHKPWSLLVYIAGDNDLSDFGLQDIEEMCAVGASPNTHVGVEIDTRGEHDGSVRYDITEPDWTNTAHRAVIERLSEHDSGSPLALQQFLNWGVKRYSAEERLVVVWNHGAGFRRPSRDIAYDDYGSSLDMPELTWALRAAGFNKENKVSLLGFDACLMSMLEIADHVSDYVSILVGSQEVEPGEGWPYHEVLAHANAAPNPETLAKEIVDVYIESCKKLGRRGVTQSAIDLSKTRDAVAALDALGMELLSSDNLAAMEKIRLSVQCYEMVDYVDAVDLANRIVKMCDVKSLQDAAEGLIHAIERAVIANAKWGKNVDQSHGLSVWFPPSRNLYIENRNKYLALRGIDDKAEWVEFLDAYHLE